MECLLISPLNYIGNINFFLYSIFCDMVILLFFCHINICSDQRTCWNSKCIFMLFFGIRLSYFGVFIRAILERVCQSCNIYNASPFLLCSFESIYLSIYLPTNNLPTNLSIRSYGPSFLKAVLSAETLSFIKSVYRQIQIQTKALYELFWIVYICTVIKNSWVKFTKFTFCPYVLSGHYDTTFHIALNYLGLYLTPDCLLNFL